ncbi:MAG TPA: MFS transporter [Afifellaceae bacterium]|nr:MFS transporter [Afifellaceae bacterium]
MPIAVVLAIVGFASAVSLRNTDPLLPLIATDFGIAVTQAALLATAFTLPYAVMQLVLGPIGDAVGKALLIRVCVTVLALALLVSAVAPAYPALVAARMLAGGFAGGLIPVAMALIGDRVPFERRQLAISRLLFATLSGQLVGAASAGLLADAAGWRGVFALSAAITAASAVLALVYLKPSGQPRKPVSLAAAMAGYREVMRNPRSRAVYLLVMAEGLIVFGSFPFVVVLLELHGSGGVVQAGIVIAAFAVGGLVYTGLVGWLLRVAGQRRMMALGGAIGGACLAAAALPVAWPVTAALFFGLGLGFFMVHNSFQTEASELAPGARASAFALFASLYFLGQGIGVLLVREAAVMIGLPAVMIGLGALFAGLGAIAARAIGRP